MIRLLFYVALIVMGLIIGPQLMHYKGYVMLSVADYTVETSIVGLVLIALVGFGALQIAEWLVVKLVQMSGATLLWPQRWRKKRAKKQTVTGALAMAEQNWSLAEKSLATAADASDTPVMNYLAAAQAAHHGGERQAWQHYLQQAEQDPVAKHSVPITRLHYLMDEQDWPQARLTYDGLLPEQQHHPVVLQLALALFKEQQDWAAMAQLLPELKRKKLLNEPQLNALKAQVTEVQLQAQPDLEHTHRYWKQLPRAERKQTTAVVAYSKKLLSFEAKADVRRLILKQLDKTHPQASLLSLLVQASHDVAEEISHILKRKYTHQQTADLHDALAALAELTNQPEQALQYRQHAVDADATLTRYRHLIALQEQLNQQKQALSNYRAMLALLPE